MYLKSGNGLLSGKQYIASLVLNFVSICALDHSTLKASMKTVLIGDYSGSEGQKIWLCWMWCWIGFCVVFLVDEGPADNRGEHVMKHCRTCSSPRLKGGRQMLPCGVAQMGRRGSGAATSCPGHMTPMWRWFRAGQRLLGPSLLAASKNGMLLWLISVWL